MRTLRLSLAGMVILALLGGLGGAVVAQPEESNAMPEEATADAVEPVLLQLTFNGESCTYEGATELTPGPVELLFRNESEGVAATNMVSIDEGYTVQDVVDPSLPA